MMTTAIPPPSMLDQSSCTGGAGSGEKTGGQEGESGDGECVSEVFGVADGSSGGGGGGGIARAATALAFWGLRGGLRGMLMITITLRILHMAGVVRCS